tara:strand:+ start:1266 stop:2534 length:1269 start_codon:yes stop_codon:yes gene_type:complete
MTNSLLCIKESLTNENKSKVKRGKVIKFSDKELNFKVYTSIHDCEQYWECISCEDPFYSPEYFKILENEKLSGAIPMYAFAFIKDEENPLCSFHFQKKKLRLIDSIDTDKFVEGGGIGAKFKYWLQRIFFPLVYFNMIVVGNLLLTGKYGFRGANNKITISDYEVLRRMLKGLKCQVSGTEFQFRGALIKDFFEEEKCLDTKKVSLGEFKVDPSMIVHVRSDWNSMDDYLLDMKSKHRVRTKKHLKKGAELEIRPLTAEEVEQRELEIHGLYSSVIKASGFNMVTVNKGYFTDMVKTFPDQFVLNGMFLGESLVGFYTSMLKEGAMMSHFIGYNENRNKEHSIYMNILLYLIKDAIQQKVNKLYYYRTALEIKSSVGAEPKDMYLYLMHNNFIANSMINIVIKTFFPNPMWTQRKPFKSYPE